MPRLRWKLGTVKDLIQGRDNLVRAAVVQIASEDRRTEIKRPVQKLYPDDVQMTNSDLTQPNITFIPDKQVEFIHNN